MCRVFVSYSRRDIAVAAAVTDWLVEREPGLQDEIFLDVDPLTGIAPGTRWKQELARAVDRCEAVICLISAAWEQSSECLTEFRLAESLNKRIFCVRIDPAATGQKVSEWQFCDLFVAGDGPTVTIPGQGDGSSVTLSSTGLDQLLRGLREAGIGAEHFPWPPTGQPNRAPYCGWQPMEDVDAAVFFGRDAQLLRALDTLRGMRGAGVERLFVILGPSGVGKSSFLRAGLLPRLRRDTKDFAVCEIVRPGRAAITGDHGLAQAVAHIRTQAGLTQPPLGHIKAACLAGQADRLASWLSEAAQRLGDEATPTLVLPIDQAEEFFAADAGSEANTCLELLGSLMRTDAEMASPVLAVATIRADRYEALQTAPALHAVHGRPFGDLKPMPLTEFKEVVVGPAERASAGGRPLRLEPELIDRLLTEATGGADSLPLLALTLSRLYLDYGSSGELTLANYEAMGGMQRIVQTEVDSLLSVDPDEQARQLDVLHSAFIPWLATVDSKTDQPSRRVARWQELPANSHDLIAAMVSKRLLVQDERDGEPSVEVALESLFRQWDALSNWIRERAEDLKAADNLDRDTTDWEHNGRNQEWLIGGLRLEAAERLAAAPMFAGRLRPSAAFLQASRAREDAEVEAERQRHESELQQARERQDEAERHAAALHRRSRVQRKLLMVAAITTVLALAGLVGTAFALHQADNQRQIADTQRQAAEDRSREVLGAQLSSQGQAILAGRQPGSELEAVVKILAAQHVSPKTNPSGLLTALYDKLRLQSVYRSDATLCEDGEHMVITSRDGARLIETNGWKPVGQPFRDLQWLRMGLSFDGRYLASFNYSSDKAIRVWDFTQGRYVGQPMLGTAEFASDVAVSHDGRHVAARDSNRAVRLWDVDSGRLIAQLPVDEDFVTTLAFSPDGRLLATPDNEHFTVRLWDAATGASLRDTLPARDDRMEGDDTIWSLAFSADGSVIAAGGKTVGLSVLQAGEPLRIWNVAPGSLVAPPVIGDYGQIRALAFSPDGRRIVTGSDDRAVRVWDAKTNQLIGAPQFMQSQVWQVAFTRSGKQIVAVSDQVQLLDADPGAQLPVETAGSRSAGLKPGTRYGVDTSAESTQVVFVRDGGLHWFDAAGGQRTDAFVNEALRSMDEIAYTDDHRWVAVAADGIVQVFDSSDGRIAAPPLTGQGRVRDMQFTDDGATLVTAARDKPVRRWDWRTGKEVGKPLSGNASAVESLSFTPNGDRLIARSFDSIWVYDMTKPEPTGEQLGGKDGTARVGTEAMALSRDGKHLATANEQGQIQQWDFPSLKPRGRWLLGHNEISDVSYSPDGRYLVSAGNVGTDDTLRFWDAESGDQLGAPIDTKALGAVASTSFSKDGHWVYLVSQAISLNGSGPREGRTAVWQVPAPPEWRSALCQKLAMNPDKDEWKAWVSDEVAYQELCTGKPPPS